MEKNTTINHLEYAFWTIDENGSPFLNNGEITSEELKISSDSLYCKKRKISEGAFLVKSRLFFLKTLGMFPSY